MKLTSTVQMKYDDGMVAKIVLTTIGVNLTRDEATQQHDQAVDQCVDVVRSLMFTGAAPLRCVKIR